MKTCNVCMNIWFKRRNAGQASNLEKLDRISRNPKITCHSNPAGRILCPHSSNDSVAACPGVVCEVLTQCGHLKIALLMVSIKGLGHHLMRCACKAAFDVWSIVRMYGCCICCVSDMAVVQVVFRNVLLQKDFNIEVYLQRKGVLLNFFLFWYEYTVRSLKYQNCCVACCVWLHNQNSVIQGGRNTAQKRFPDSFLPIFVRRFGYCMENDVWLNKEKLQLCSRKNTDDSTVWDPAGYSCRGKLCCSSCMTGFSCCHRTGMNCVRPCARSRILRSGSIFPALLIPMIYTGLWKSTA